MNKPPLLSKRGWRLLAKILIGLFVVLFTASFITLTFLEGYYPGHRPHAPRPTTGQTVHLPWTNPVSYGSASDAALVYRVFWLGMYSWALYGLGWAIRVYILGEEIPIRGVPTRFGRLTRESRDDSE